MVRPVEERLMLLFTLLGCTAWIDQEPACGLDVYWWSDDLLSYVLTGDGSGEFDFDPDDTPRDEVDGAYDPTTGDFSYKTGYEDGYYYVRAATEGFGTVYHSGNLDLLFTTTVLDVLDATFATTYRVQRDGCDMTVATWDADSDSDSALVMTGTYADASTYNWTASSDGYSYQGAMRDNLSHSYQIDADDGSYWEFDNFKPDGTINGELEYTCSDYDCKGTTTREFDGSLTTTLTAYDGDDVYYESTGSYDYDGSGTEEGTYHITGGDVSCTYTTDSDANCTYECDDGSDGSC